MLTKTFDKQTARFLATVATCMPSLSGEIMQGWIDNPKALTGVLRALSPPVTEQLLHSEFAETRLLMAINKSTLRARTNSFDLAKFYQMRTGPYVFDAFIDHFDLKFVGSSSQRLYMTAHLKENACDTDIRRELSEVHLSRLEDIASFIKRQSGGKLGFLLNNGCVNIFYVKGKNGEIFAVLIRWGTKDRDWSVGTLTLDSGNWNVGDRVLFPVNVRN